MRPGTTPRPWIGGKPAATIDEIPLDWCYRPGVKLDFRSLPDGHVVSAAEVEAELERIGHELAPLDIVVVNTAAGARYGAPDYVDRGCGMGRDATLYLTSRGVRITGTDGWSWDAPFVHTARRYAQTKDASIIWEGHKAGREIGYCHLEKLHNLELLAGDRLHGGVLSGEDPPRLRRLDPGGGDSERLIPRTRRIARGPSAIARRRVSLPGHGPAKNREIAPAGCRRGCVPDRRAAQL